MDQGSVHNANRVVWAAGDDVRRVIIEEGRRNLESAIAVSAALQARVVQAAALLFAAASLAATTTLTARGPVAALIAAAAVAFAVGGLYAFWAIRSRQIILPGVPPSWWVAADQIATWKEKDAHYWLAGHIERALQELGTVQKRRADGLYFALVAGAMGGIFMAVAAAWRVIAE